MATLRSWLILVFFLSGWGFAADTTRTLALNDFPLLGKRCEQTAQSLAGSLVKSFSWIKDAVGTCVTSTGCREGNIRIRYISESGKKIFSSDPWPFFNSYSSCIAKISAEKEAFTLLTGLDPFLSYCADHTIENGWEGNTPLYSPRFVAEGTPKRIPKTVSLPIREGFFIGGKALAGEIVKKAKSVGLPVTGAFFDGIGKGYDSRLWLRLDLPAAQSQVKAENLFLLKNQLENFSGGGVFSEHRYDPMEAESPEQCEFQRKQAQRIFDSAFSGPVVWFCMWDRSLFTSRLYHLRIRAGAESFDRIAPGDDKEPFLNSYSSTEECENDKHRVVAHYKNKFGDRVLGALCSWKSRRTPRYPSKVFVYLAEKKDR